MTENAQPAQAQEPKKTGYVLVVTNKAKNTEGRYAIDDGRELVIGADPQCAVYVDDDYASFRHFVVRNKEGKVEVSDLGSKNGLFLLLGKDAVELKSGQTVLAGRTLFRLEVAENEPDGLVSEAGRENQKQV